MSILVDICSYKKEYLQHQENKTPLKYLLKNIENIGSTRNFKSKIDTNFRKGELSVIAEIKKASPSKGIIKKDFYPLEIAKQYEEGNATCLSILTDEKYFKGSDAILRNVRKNSTLPILRKDFIISEYQIYETRSIGADCILFIHSILKIDVLKKFVNLAKSLDLDILIEVHNKEELFNVIDINDVMIGINNRNLNNMKVDIKNAISLYNVIPDNFNVVCESGIDNMDKLAALHKKGFLTFLIGEYLMKQDRPSNLLKQILDLNKI